MNKSLIQEILEEIKKTENLIKEENQYIDFLSNQLKENPRFKEIINLFKDNQSLNTELIKVNFIKFLMLFLSITCFILLLLYLFYHHMTVSNNFLDYNFMFRSFMIAFVGFIFFQKMSHYEFIFQNLSSEKRSLEKIIHLLKINEKLYDKEDYFYKVLEEILSVYIQKLKK